MNDTGDFFVIGAPARNLVQQQSRAINPRTRDRDYLIASLGYAYAYKVEKTVSAKK